MLVLVLVQAIPFSFPSHKLAWSLLSSTPFALLVADLTLALPNNIERARTAPHQIQFLRLRHPPHLRPYSSFLTSPQLTFLSSSFSTSSSSSPHSHTLRHPKSSPPRHCSVSPAFFTQRTGVVRTPWLSRSALQPPQPSAARADSHFLTSHRRGSRIARKNNLHGDRHHS